MYCILWVGGFKVDWSFQDYLCTKHLLHSLISLKCCFALRCWDPLNMLLLRAKNSSMTWLQPAFLGEKKVQIHQMRAAPFPVAEVIRKSLCDNAQQLFLPHLPTVHLNQSVCRCRENPGTSPRLLALFLVLSSVGLHLHRLSWDAPLPDQPALWYILFYVYLNLVWFSAIKSVEIRLSCFPAVFR